MNNVCLVGRLTRDPELRSTKSGTPVCSYTLAVDRQYKSDGQPTADFISIVSWEKAAEFVANYFTKGMRVFVVGRLQVRQWEDQEGNKRYSTEVVSNQVGFADGYKDSDRSEKSGRYDDDGFASSKQFAGQSSVVDEISDADVPF